MTNVQQYLNKDKNTCVTLPRKVSKCLQVDNFLSEYDTDEERELAMLNLLLLDETPTEGSTRLVNSGDLAKTLNNYKLEVNNVLDNYELRYNSLLDSVLEEIDHLNNYTVKVDKNYFDFNEDSELTVSNKLFDPEKYSGLGKYYFKPNIQEVVPYKTWCFRKLQDGIFLLFYGENDIYSIVNSTEYGLVLRDTIVDVHHGLNVLSSNLNYVEQDGIITVTLPDGSTITNEEINNSRKYVVSENGTVNKNIISEFPYPNTMYYILYDFDLNGATLTIPENCILIFDGGSISNGTLVGSNTQIIASKVSIFTGITIDGTWNVPEITSAWFADATQDNVSRQMFNLTDDSVFNTVIFNTGIFNVSTSSDNEAVFHVKSNTKVILSGDIQLAVNALNYYFIFDINGVSNVEISGGGSISGDYTGNPEESGHTGAYGHGHGIRITDGSEAVSINNLSISNCAGDAIYIGRKTNSGLPVSQKISIERCNLYDCARQGISVCHAVNVNISGCEIYNIKKEKPSSGIDIEPNVNDTCRNIVITHNDIHECFHGITTNYNNATGVNIYNVTVASNKIEGTLKSGMSLQEVENISIHNNYISTTSKLLEYEDTVFTIRGKSNLRNCAIFCNEIINTKEGYVDDGNKKNIAAVLIGSSKVCKIFSNTITASSIPAFALVGQSLSLENNIVSSPYIFSPLWNVDSRSIVGNNFEGYCDMSVRYGCLISGNVFTPATGINGGDNSFTSALNLLKIYGENYTFANNDVRIPMQATCDLSSSVNSVIGNVFDIDVEGVYGSDARIIVLKNALFENNRVYIKSLNQGVDPGSIIVINGTGRGTYKKNTFVNSLGSEENPVTLGRCMMATSEGTMIEICSNRVSGNFTSVYPSNVRYYNLLHDNKKNIGTTFSRMLITEDLTEDDAGHMYFDTDLGKPVYWNGICWIDANDILVDYRYHNTVANYNIGKKINTREDIGTIINYQNPTNETLIDCKVLNVHAGDLIKIVGVGAYSATSYALVDNDGKLLKRSASVKTADTYDYPPKLYVNIEVDCKLILNFRNANIVESESSQDYIKVPYGNHREIPYEVTVYSNLVPFEEPADNT